jgi:hypothetical protein
MLHSTFRPASRFHNRPVWRDQRVQRLAARLPARLRRAVYHMRQPTLRWVRLPTGIVFVIVGIALLPVPPFVSWMIPVGFVLVAEDVPFARNCLSRVLDLIEERKPEWLQRPRR